MPKRPEISVIVPALNEAKYIHNLFEGLRTQGFRNFETIVVDGGSKDKTREIARRSGARVIVERRKGIGRARNVGAKAARGRLLVFLDADTKPCRSLLYLYLRALGSSDAIAATGPIMPLEKSNLLVRLGFLFVSVIFVKASVLFGRPSLVGLNFAVRKRAFDKIHGFNDDYITYEDWDLSLRLSKLGRIEYLDDAVVWTSVRRIEAWGISGFFMFHVGNMLRYNTGRKPKERYAPIR